MSKITPKLVERAIVQTDKENFEESFTENFKKASSDLKAVSFSSTNVFDIINSGSYNLVFEEEYHLTVLGVIVHSKKGFNELTQKFDIEIWFNEQGIVRKEITFSQGL